MENDIVLQIGMSDKDGTVTIVDEDRLCYKVRNQSKGSCGIRTISKDLLNEWIEEVRVSPNLGSFELRDKLKGRTEVDKFEYGYNSTLKLLAEMVLGRVPIVDNPEIRVKGQNKGDKCEEDGGTHCKKNILESALTVFKRERLGGWWKKGMEVNGKVREWFEGVKIEELGVEGLVELFYGGKDANGERLELMWASGWGKTGPRIKEEIEKDCARVRDFILGLKKPDAVAAFCCSSNYDNRPKGFGPAVVSELLMKFHPKECLAWSDRREAIFGKLGIRIPSGCSQNAFTEMMGAGARVLERMRGMGIARAIGADGKEDGAEADYLTVNEFLWFVNERWETVLKEVSVSNKREFNLPEQRAIAGLGDFITEFHKAAGEAGLIYGEGLVRRFACALMAKPFVVLTGLSGSGKTKLAEAFTRWIASVDGMARIVPVGADWSNREMLLGFPNALDAENYILPDTGVLQMLIDANDNPDVPFFLILDEMNLSHVERYFADFLSAMESGGEIRLYDGKTRTAANGAVVPQTVKFPKNLFTIGTMNVDETTHMFSPKVLDRAQVVEFRVSVDQMKNYLANAKPLKMGELDGKGAGYAKAFLELCQSEPVMDDKAKGDVAGALNEFFPELANLGAEFAFRTAGEARRFCGFGVSAGMGTDEAIDAAVMQKLLPKLHGSRRRLAPALEKFWEFCRKGDKTKTLVDAIKEGASVEGLAKYPVSAEKIVRLWRALEANGYAGYAEA